MLPFITDEHRMIAQAARDFGRNSIAPIAAEHDETGEFPLKTIREMGQLGFMGIEVPEEYGGAGMDTLAYVLAMVEISKADASHGTIMSVNNSLYAHGLLKFGTEEQKQKYLVPIATGQKIGAYSLTEPMSGSDAGTMKSRAVLNPEGTAYVINGRKSWVTSAPYADVIILFTMTQPEKKHRGVTAFIIETDQPGFIRGKKEPKLGIRASATSEIIFDNYECPVENRLGAEGEGFKIAMTCLLYTSPASSAFSRRARGSAALSPAPLRLKSLTTPPAAVTRHQCARWYSRGHRADSEKCRFAAGPATLRPRSRGRDRRPVRHAAPPTVAER